MNPIVATILTLIGITGLFWLYRDQHARPSKALWLPTIWLFVNSSRPLTMWLGILGLHIGPSNTSDTYMEGSPVDAALFGVLLLGGVFVLSTRSQQVSALLRRNWAILLFFGYCFISFTWSSFPLVTIKHWIKGIGDVVMVLVVLTDAEPRAALERICMRVGFLVIPLSVLFIKYFGEIGREYSHGGDQVASGVTTQKNTLGVICLIFGLWALWRVLELRKQERSPRRRNQLVALYVILLMVPWLFYSCKSVTSMTSFAMAATVMIVASRQVFVPQRWIVHALMGTMLAVSLFALFFDSSGSLLQAVGRNPTLTGRTAIWNAVIPLQDNPVIGTGYESFWLGDRLQYFWKMKDYAFSGIQEAHNGYLEVWLNLGWIGILLLALVVLRSYGSVVAAFRRSPAIGSLGLAFFIAELTYNFTEAGFRMMFPLWFFFLAAAMPFPESLPAVAQTDEGQERLRQNNRTQARARNVVQPARVKLRQEDPQIHTSLTERRITAKRPVH